MKTIASVAISLTLGCVLNAQGTATTYGTACSGSCISANADVTKLKGSTQNSNIFAMGVAPRSTPRLVLGFSLYTNTLSTTTPLTINTQVYDSVTTGTNTGKPNKLLASSTMKVGTTAGWYTTILAKPLLILPNTKIFISYTGGASKIRFPFDSRATAVKTGYFWHSSTATAWNGKAPNGFVTQAWCWKLVCAGPAPVLSFTGVPSIGTTFKVNLSSVKPGADAIMAMGISDSTWSGIKLPLSLAPNGANGCNLYISLDVQIGVKADALGRYSISLKVPNDIKLKGLKFFVQFAVIDPEANAMGLSLTQGGAGKVG